MNRRPRLRESERADPEWIEGCRARRYVLLVIGLLPLALRRWTRRYRSVLRLVLGAVGLSWAVTIPLAVLFVAGAYPADGSLSGHPYGDGRSLGQTGWVRAWPLPTKDQAAVGGYSLPIPVDSDFRVGLWRALNCHTRSV